MTGISPIPFDSLEDSIDELIARSFPLATFFIKGAAEVTTGEHTFKVEGAWTLTKMEGNAKAGNGPAGAAQVVGLTLDGTDLFATAPNPQIAAAAITGSVAAFDDTSATDGQVLAFTVVSVGATPGTDVTWVVWAQPA